MAIVFGREDTGLLNDELDLCSRLLVVPTSELNSSLNLRDGGEFSQTMRRLYNYFDERLQTANIHKQSEPLLEVKDEKLLETALLQIGLELSAKILRGGVLVHPPPDSPGGRVIKQIGLEERLDLQPRQPSGRAGHLP